MPAKLLFPPGRRGKTTVGNTEQKMVSVINELQNKSCQCSGRSLLLAEGLRRGFKEEVTLKQILKDGKALQMQGKGGWSG